MATRISWTKPQPGSTIPLYQELLEMREAGLTHSEIRAELMNRHGIEVSIGNVAKALKRYRDGATVEEGADNIAWAEPMEGSDRPLWEEAKAIKEAGLTWKETAEELQSRYGISVVAGTVSGMVGYHGKKAAADGGSAPASGDGASAPAALPRNESEQELRPTGEGGTGGKGQRARGKGERQTAEKGDGSPCVLHVALDGFEIWVTGRDENEFLVKLQTAQNLLAMAVNG